MKIYIVTFLIYVLMLVGVSCSSSTTKSGKAEYKPPVSTDQRSLIKKTLMSTTTYDITVNTDSPVLQNLRSAIQNIFKRDSALINTCSGTGTMQIYSDYSQKMDGKLSCFGIEFNLADTLATSDVERVKEDMSKYDYYGVIMRENNPKITNRKIPVGSAYFQPPKPLMINPMINPSTIPTPIVEQSSVVVANDQGIQNKSSGTFTIEILDANAPIPSDVEASYIKGDLVHMDIKTSGFSGVQSKGQYLLYKSRQMYISLNPVIIAKMIITSPLTDIITSSSDSVITGTFLKTLVGDLTITFSMSKHEVESSSED